jgi:hypothetical protein
MGARNEVLVTADPAKNLLQCAFVGDIGPEEFARYQPVVAEALATLSHGFHLLVDLTELDSMDLELVPAIGEAMELFQSRGVERIVRIIPDQSKDIGLGILSIFHYPRGLQIITCENRAEAINALS